MRRTYLLAVFAAMFFTMCAQGNKYKINKTLTKEQMAIRYNSLTPQEERVIIHKEPKFHTLQVIDNDKEGIYLCKRCDAPLYRSEDKFDGHWGGLP